jgi:putative membrane protein
VDDEQATPRRTWLAAERTWLAWWRTALAASVAALAVGRLVPELLGDDATWPFVALGLGYGAVAVGVFVAGARRHGEIEAGLTDRPFRPLGHGLVNALTLAGAGLTLLSMVLIALAA